MSIEEKQHLKETTYTEAMRYMDNAVTLLKEKGQKDGNHYRDIKYVKMACGTAYSAALLALDAYLAIKGTTIEKKKHQRKSVDDYKRILSRIDRKALDEYIDTYNILHLSGYYDGINKVDIIWSGLESAQYIVNRIKPRA